MSVTWSKNVTSIDRHEAQADQDRDHPVGAFRGLAFGLLIALPFWLGVAQAWYMGWLR